MRSNEVLGTGGLGRNGRYGVSQGGMEDMSKEEMRSRDQRGNEGQGGMKYEE